MEPVPVVGDDTVVGTTFVSQAAQQDEDERDIVRLGGCLRGRGGQREGQPGGGHGRQHGPFRHPGAERGGRRGDAETAKGTAPVRDEASPAEADEDDADDPLPPPDNFPTAGLPAPKGTAKADEPDPEEPTK